MSVIAVPFLNAFALTLGAALSYSTHDRPCSSLPVTTRRMGLMPSAMSVSRFLNLPTTLIGVKVSGNRGPRMRRDRVHVRDDIDNDGLPHRDRALERVAELTRLLDADTCTAKRLRYAREVHVREAPHFLGSPALLAAIRGIGQTALL